jgi:hypothetical protein
MDNNDLANITQEMIDLLERVGWSKGVLEDYRNGIVVGYCTLGAYCEVTSRRYGTHPATTNGQWSEEFAAFLIHEKKVSRLRVVSFNLDSYETITVWNDDAGSVDDIISGYRSFISYLKGGDTSGAMRTLTS